VQQVSKELTSEAVSAGFKGAVSKSTGSEVVKAIEVLLKHQSFFQPIRSDSSPGDDSFQLKTLQVSAAVLLRAEAA